LDAPSGSFERFLADLQTDVGMALIRNAELAGMQQSNPAQEASLRSSAVESEGDSESSTATPQARRQTEDRSSRFAFFRSYQFPNQRMGPNGSLEPPVVPSGEAAPSSPENMALLEQTPSPATTEPESTSPQSSQQPQSTPVMVTPLIFVGVRRLFSGETGLFGMPLDDSQSTSPATSPLESSQSPVGLEGDVNSESHTAEEASSSNAENTEQWLIWIVSYHLSKIPIPRADLLSCIGCWDLPS